MVTTIYWSNPAATLHAGDARDVLTAMPDGSADCIVTSPPYWAKRDYGVAGQYGCEPDPAGYVATLRAMFSEARRVLADDGTCWLNLGDSYSAGSATPSGKHAYIGPGLMGRHAPGMEAKNLLGLPWRVALALQDDGWIIRNAIVWHKPNAMPESVRDRLNCRYELVFLLVKSRHYWFDLDPIRRAARHRPDACALPPGPRRRQRRASARRSAGEPSAPWRHAAAQVRRPYAGRSSPRDGTALGARVMPRTRGVAIPATSGPSPPAPTGARTSPRTRSSCRRAASRRAASRAAWCSTRSAAPAPPALPPSPSDGSFTGIELNPAFAALAAERLRQAAQPEPDGTEGGRP